MEEIEILVEVYDNIDSVRDKLKDFKQLGAKHTIDKYYYDPKRTELKPSKSGELFHCLRLRKKDNDYYITYKDDVFEDNKWLYSNEYETKVDDIITLETIFNKLGLVSFIEIDNLKETYIYDDYEIVLESVKDLGLFLEVEYIGNDKNNIKDIKEKIQTFIDNLNIDVSEELNVGKPELYLKKHNIKMN